VICIQKSKSISSGAQYVICTVKLYEEKSKHAGLVPKYGFLISKIAHFAVVDLNRRSNPACAPAETPIMNMMI
jgi:hypothetical protein